MASAVKNGNGASPAAVIDIGSNTTRLLVAERRGDGDRVVRLQPNPDGEGGRGAQAVVFARCSR